MRNVPPGTGSMSNETSVAGMRCTKGRAAPGESAAPAVAADNTRATNPIRQRWYGASIKVLPRAASVVAGDAGARARDFQWEERASNEPPVWPALAGSSCAPPGKHHPLAQKGKFVVLPHAPHRR